MPVMVPADVHEPDEAAVFGTGNCKCANQPAVVELPVVLLASDLPPALPIR
jgi:hypothetical protein